MEKTLKIAALVCHDNVSFDLATEQQAICKNFQVFPSFPLICPLAKVEPAEKNQDILAQYQNIFQSLKEKPVLMPVEYDDFFGIFYRRMQIKKTEGFPLCDEGFFGRITLAKTSTLPFLFNEFEEYAGNLSFAGSVPAISSGQIAEKIKSTPVELRVFKLAVFSFCLNNCGNFRSANWQQESSRWIKLC